MTEPFTLSIEEQPGIARQHGFHLGTDERLARQIACQMWHNRANNGFPVVTVALKRQGKIVDVYYGDRWHNEGEAWS